MPAGAGHFEVVGTGVLGMPTFAATPTIYLIFGLLAFIPFAGLMMILYTTAGVTIPFLKARLSRGPSQMIALMQKNGMMAFIPGKYYSGSGVVETKHDGSYFQVGEGVYYASGVPISIAFEDYGINLTPEFIAAAHIQKYEGIENYQQMAENLNMPEGMQVFDVDTESDEEDDPGAAQSPQNNGNGGNP